MPLDNDFLSKLNKELEGSFEKQEYSQGITSFIHSLENKLDKKDETKNGNKIKFGLDKNKKLTPEEKTRLEIADGRKEGAKIGAIIIIFIILFLIFLIIVSLISDGLKKKKVR